MTPVKQQRRYASGKSGKIRSKGRRNETSPVSSRLRESNADLLVFVGVVPMQMIAPCVKRAFLDSDLLSEYMTQVELLGNVIASAGFGLVLVRSNRQIVCANDAAEKLMRASSGLRCEHGYICAPNFNAAWKLQSLISAASRPIDEAVPGGSIILRNEDGLASLVVHVVPFSPPSTVLMPDNERPVAGLFIVDCQRGTADRVDVFADLFELTSAETRVLAQMILGEGLTIAARRLNIARSTARSHLDHILQKTGTHRQAELVRIFFETTIPWNGTVTLPYRIRNKSPGTSASRRTDDFTSRLRGQYPESPIQGTS